MPQKSLMEITLLSATLGATCHPAQCRALYINKKPRLWRDIFQAFSGEKAPLPMPPKCVHILCHASCRARAHSFFLKNVAKIIGASSCFVRDFGATSALRNVVSGI